MSWATFLLLDKRGSQNTRVQHLSEQPSPPFPPAGTPLTHGKTWVYHQKGRAKPHRIWRERVCVYTCTRVCMDVCARPCVCAHYDGSWPGGRGDWRRASPSWCCSVPRGPTAQSFQPAAQELGLQLRVTPAGGARPRPLHSRLHQLLPQLVPLRLLLASTQADRPSSGIH